MERLIRLRSLKEINFNCHRDQAHNFATKTKEMSFSEPSPALAIKDPEYL